MTRWVVLVAVGAFVAGASVVLGATPSATADSLRTMASEYYRWRDQNYPVASSSQGLHTWDDRLTDYSGAAVAARRKHVGEIQARVRAISADGARKFARCLRPARVRCGAWQSCAPKSSQWTPISGSWTRS